MAKFEISDAGLDALKKLKNDLQQSNTNLESCCNTLRSTIDALSDLGSYKSKIESLVETMTGAQKEGREAVETLCGKLDTLTSRMESILSSWR